MADKNFPINSAMQNYPSTKELKETMKKIQILIILLLVIYTGGLHAQQTSKTSLLVAVCNTEKKCEPQKIKRFNFERGKLISSEDVLAFFANTERFERVTYRLVQNRYVISRLGDVLDIQTNEMFGDERGDYFGADGDKIYIFQNKGGTDVKLVTFDLQSKKYKRVELSSVFFLFGVRSPSMLRSVQYDIVQHTLEINHRVKNRAGDLNTSIDGRFVVKCGKNCKDGDILPMVWLDDERLLTQKKNGELVVIDLKKEETRTIVKIPVKDELEFAPVLFKDFAGNIIYRADKNYLIDVENKKYQETYAVDIGNKFQASIEPGEKVFTFDGKEIGKYRTAYYSTAKNYLAVELSNEKDSYYYPKGIAVWSEETREWTTLDVNYSPKIIGWFK